MLAVVLAVTGSVPAFAEESITYVYRAVQEDGTVKEASETCSEYTAVTDSTTSWSAGWYVVNSEVSIASRVTVSGTVNLILCDGYTLTVNGGINVSNDRSLTIYGQTGDTGKLVISGVADEKAGIGSGKSKPAGTITVNGSSVTITGGKYGAGIGGGRNGTGGNIIINGGSVTAAGGDSGAGIGGGRNAKGGTITINGGTVSADGGTSGTGIGGGWNGDGGTITINGGTVSADGGTSGAGIGGGYSASGGNITINGGRVTASSSTNGAGIGGGLSGDCGVLTITGGTVITQGGKYAAGIGGGYHKSGGTITISGGTVSADAGERGAGIGGGLEGAGGTITISGGKVSAEGAQYGAGIGGGRYGSGGKITISGDSNVTAQGGQYGAGIGGGSSSAGGTITISNGSITATGGASGAGIGGGLSGDCEVVTISGGTIIAAGGSRGAGIGGGNNKNGGTITITGGTISADGGEHGAGIGGGRYGNGGTVIVSNGTVKAAGGGNGSGIGHGVSGKDGGTLTLCLDETTQSITITASASTDANVFTATTKVSGDRSFYVVGNESTVVSGTIAEPRTTINGKTLKPFYVTTVQTDESYTVTCSPVSAKEGDTVTLTYADVAGYDLTFYVNGNAIEGDTFTMPSKDVVLSVESKAIEYTITYNLDGGSLADGTSNPTTYTVETGDFTLNNPSKSGYSFAGWLLSGDSTATAYTTLTITKGSTGNRTYTATWTPAGGSFTPSDASKPAFAYFSLILADQIGVNFYMYQPEIDGIDYTNGQQCWMSFDVNGDTSNNAQVMDQNFYLTVNGTKYYGYRCYINSLQMADKISAVFSYGDNSITKEYSAKDYLDAAMSTYTGVDYDILAAIMDYGHYAQVMLAEEHKFTVGSPDNGADYAEMPKHSDYTTEDYSKVKTSTDQYAFVNGNVGGSGIVGITYSLNLDSQTKINIFLTVSDDYTGGVTASLVNGGEINVTPHGEHEYLIQLDGISAHMLGTPYEVQITAAKTFNVSVSVLSYVNAVLTQEAFKDSTNMLNAVTALYKYYEATMAYRAAYNYKD